MDICEKARKEKEESDGYGYADKWAPIHLDEGDKLYQLDFLPDKPNAEPIGSHFFIDEDTYDLYWDPETNSFDVKSYCHDSQIAPFYKDEDGFATYKNHISEYEVGDGGLDVAYGTCENNSSYGEGGGSQIYVDEDSMPQLQKTNGQIVPEISDRDRWVGKTDYNQMMDDLSERKQTDENIQTNNNGISSNADDYSTQSQNVSNAPNPNDMSTLTSPSSQQQAADNLTNSTSPIQDDYSMDSLSFSSPSKQESNSNDMTSIAPQTTENESQTASPDNSQQPQAESIDSGIER